MKGRIEMGKQGRSTFLFASSARGGLPKDRKPAGDFLTRAQPNEDRSPLTTRSLPLLIHSLSFLWRPHNAHRDPAIDDDWISCLCDSN